MPDKQVERDGENDSTGQVLTMQKKYERTIKGYKGQVAKLQRELAQRGGAQAPPSQEGVQNESGQAQSESKEAASKHFVRSWERICPDCGEPNEHYEKPNAYCGDCGVPLGRFKDQAEAGEKVKTCWNCESTKGKWVD